MSCKALLDPIDLDEREQGRLWTHHVAAVNDAQRRHGDPVGVPATKRLSWLGTYRTDHCFIA